jgi:glycosyltransferase involved in cell wall biosynthesis
VAAERHLATVAHSYVVAENRRLAHEMALAGRGRWRVTALAPPMFAGDLRRIALEPIEGEASALRRVPMRLQRFAHLAHYASLARALPADADVVHVWEEPYVLAGAQIARAAPGRARVVFATFQNIDKRYPWPLSAFERTSMTRADGWIAFGRTAAETLAPRRGYQDKPHRVIPPGVDVDVFRPDRVAGREVRQSLGWAPDAAVVGYLGRFVPQKGITDLCDALAQSGTGWHALFVGGGPLAGEIERLSAAHPGRVKIVNGVAHSDVPRWLNAMTVLCAPSRTTDGWREQFGRMLIEAMACGIPVLASDSGEMPAVVANAGRVLPERSPSAWTRELDAVLGDLPARDAMAAAGRERAAAEFAWPVVARRHLAFFDALMDGARPS